MLLAKIDALSLRERALLFLGMLGIIYATWELFVNSTDRKDRLTLAKTLADDELRQAQLQQTMAEILTRGKIDPNADLRKRLDGLKATVQTLEARKDELSRSFILPERMVELLRGLLKSGGLRLISLETQTPRPLFKRDIKDTETPVLYRHDWVIELEGAYFELLEYLRALERQPLFWEAVDYRVKAYPLASIRLKVYSLTFERE